MSDTDKAALIKTILGEAVGEASLQWQPRPTGVFDSTGASMVVDKTFKRIMAVFQETLTLAHQQGREAGMNDAIEIVRNLKLGDGYYDEDGRIVDAIRGRVGEQGKK